MELNLQKEQFSKAYIRVVAAAAGYEVIQPGTTSDRNSVDLTISDPGGGTVIRGPYLDIQLKCTSIDKRKNPDFLSFHLPIKNYNDLRGGNFCVPRVLVVVCVPQEPSRWVDEATEDQLVLRHCGYWVSLKDKPSVDNTKTVTVKIPRKQMLDADGLMGLMTRLGNGEIP